MISKIIEASRREGVCKRICCAGNMLAAEPIIIAVPNERATPFDVLPFNELTSRLVVAGIPIAANLFQYKTG